MGSDIYIYSTIIELISHNYVVLPVSKGYTMIVLDFIDIHIAVNILYPNVKLINITLVKMVNSGHSHSG